VLQTDRQARAYSSLIKINYQTNLYSGDHLFNSLELSRKGILTNHMTIVFKEVVQVKHFSSIN